MPQLRERFLYRSRHGQIYCTIVPRDAPVCTAAHLLKNCSRYQIQSVKVPCVRLVGEKSEHHRKFNAQLAATALGGTSIEWYDFFLYGTAAALVFPVLFFPEDLPAYVALIASFSTFAVGFLARPIGGIVFGHFGDRVGRKSALVAAMTLMGVATTVIGLLPSFAQIGVIAPLALIVCRFAQGLAIGGQWGGAMLLVTENAPSNKRGFYGAFAQAGAPMGVILANLAFLIVVRASPMKPLCLGAGVYLSL